MLSSSVCLLPVPKQNKIKIIGSKKKSITHVAPVILNCGGSSYLNKDNMSVGKNEGIIPWLLAAGWGLDETIDMVATLAAVEADIATYKHVIVRVVSLSNLCSVSGSSMGSDKALITVDKSATSACKL